MNDARVDELKSLLPRCLLPDWVRLGSRAARLFRDQLHPDRHGALLERLLTEARQSVELRELRRLHVPRVSYPESLPITSRKDEIVAAIRANQVVVLAGETGSGKTTQIPKMCLEAGLGIEAMIGCTQPRRVAALSISQRIAEELNVGWGREVGCKIRFDDRSSAETYIKLMTDGILLAETQGDPDLSEYNALIIDEAHERSLNIDFLLGYLKGLLARRRDLKLVVTSATIDTQAFSRHFSDAPIIEVSGRTYPVEVVYAPFDAASEERGEITFVDAAVKATERILYGSPPGDVLIFMPGERDIRETGDLLTGRFGNDAEIIPLYGRLSAGDQQRVFAPSSRTKIVIATNIAETSLTIPGIRYVVDAGLARLSRYNPRTRTKRLPVEPVSQSSANQRKGRAGRVSDGVCIRLYSEEDFLARPAYTQPEIQRANLAEVILRMKAFRLGDIETFPFLQPPTPAAISGGYTLLQELGALDEQRALTPLGQDLARLPIDPTLGRMLLQSQHEHATRELLIIAAGLSIQDPRERPLERREAADAAHRRFTHPQSDFLALLNIWNAVHDEWETLRTQNARRKFCQQHFLSYLRMREWQDLHAQLHGALENIATVKLNESNAAYEAIHRSILAGLLGHVAHREERNTYKSSGNRLLSVFPGSILFERGEKPKPKADRKVRPPGSADIPVRTSQPQWIVAGEIVETSQLFARTLAGIDPQWIVQIAPHLCKVTLQNPHWSASSGRVLVEEIATLHGLEVQRRKVAYGNFNAKEATAIFIRAALVEEDLEFGVRSSEFGVERSESTATGGDEANRRFPFLAHNRALRQKIETWQTRMRHHNLDLDQALFDFYAKRIEGVASITELNRFVNGLADRNLLCATEADLIGDRDLSYDANAFPDAVTLAGQPVELSYAYAPGETNDGVTVRLPAELAQHVSPASVQWAVPGLRTEQAKELLESLPKSLRRELQPFAPKVAEIAREFVPSGPSLAHDLSAFVRVRYRVEVPADAWRIEAVPAHLRPRVEILGRNQQTLGAGRDLNSLRTQLEEHIAKSGLQIRDDEPVWKRLRQQWERFGVTAWNFGDLPERVTVSEGPGLPVYAWPGLQLEDGSVNVRLFRSRDAAKEAGLPAWQRLVELALPKDLAWLERDLRALARCEPAYAPLGSLEELRASALANAKRYLLPATLPDSLTAASFGAAVAEAGRRLPGLAQQLIDRVAAILQFRAQVEQRIGGVKATIGVMKAQPLKSLNQLSALNALSALSADKKVRAPGSASPFAAELESLVPPGFLDVTPFEQLHHVPRYLKALLLRIERAANNPPKEAERVRQIAPYVEALRKLQAAPPKSPSARELVGQFRWMLEEYRVSVFAQELGTAQPVSPKRLDELLERIRTAVPEVR
jgi:ATP-dependent helicase HrpA